MQNSKKKPDWLKVRWFAGGNHSKVVSLLEDLNLNTVCQAANCPNRGECFDRGTATFLIMGPNCTRHCRFCNIKGGLTSVLDPGEPGRVAEASYRLQLRHVVVTSVTRDDLQDGGSAHFAATVGAIRQKLPSASIEVLTPDFQGDWKSLQTVVDSGPDVFNHNVETVPRLYQRVRPEADYARSLELLRRVANESSIPAKSGIMVGLGETRDELCTLFADLAHSGVSILTIGQYLAPSKQHIPVNRFVTPDEFDDLASEATAQGIKKVMSAPLVRSSYLAAPL
jgi:lipoic acid synthetase